jgi:hypothetical protein
MQDNRDRSPVWLRRDEATQLLRLPSLAAFVRPATSDPDFPRANAISGVQVWSKTELEFYYWLKSEKGRQSQPDARKCKTGPRRKREPGCISRTTRHE